MKRNNFRTAICLLITAFFLFHGRQAFSATEQKTFQPVYGIILTDNVNIRAEKGTNFEVLGQLNNGTEVGVIDYKYGWYKIKLPPNAQSFVHKKFIERLLQGKRGWVKAKQLRVRAGAGTNFNVLCALNKGEVVHILEEHGDWLRITPPPNCCGWIRKDFIQLTKRPFIPGKARYVTAQDLSAPAAVKNPAPVPVKAKNTVEAEGILNDLGKIINRHGTHKLKKGRKTIYYLKSKDHDLNYYVYRKVLVKGVLEDSSDSRFPVIDVEQIKIIE